MATTTTLEQYSQQAIARHEAKHRDADSLLFNAASFTYSRKTEDFSVEVCGLIVARFKTLVGVREFCVMHNDRLLGGELSPN